MTRASILVAVIALGAVACSSAHPPPAAKTTLGGEIARVADLPIGGALVAAVAADRKVSPAIALDGLVEDALLSRGALDRHLDDDPATRRALQASLAARVMKALEAEARAKGPASPAERGTVSVVHAVALRAPGEPWEAAIAVADAIRAAAAGAPTTESFEQRARAVPHPAVRVAVERLGPFAADGTLPSGASLDRSFVAAAFALASPGDESPVIATRFGWHVIRLVDRAPANADAPADAEPPWPILDLRVRGALQSVLRSAQMRRPVELEGAIDERLSRAPLPSGFEPDAPAAGAALP